MAGFERKLMAGTLMAGTLALGLSAAAFAQAPAQGPPAAGAARKVMNASKPEAAPGAAAPKPSTAPPVQAPPQPVSPPRPEQMAPVAPLVTYQNGQLSIVAQNSTLGAILSAVRARTGAQIDVPAEASNDRVAADLGPGNPRDVMASLLQGSRFDYILLGSLDDPNGVSQVVLTRRQGAAAGENPAPSSGGNPQSGPPGPGPFAGRTTRPEINAEEDEPEPVPQSEPVPAVQNPPPQPGVYPPGTMAQPGAVVPGQVNPQIPPIQPPNAQIPGQPGQVRTPEQLLQELQRMQQQQQQQRQQE